jgi:hypothetical protein
MWLFLINYHRIQDRRLWNNNTLMIFLDIQPFAWARFHIRFQADPLSNNLLLQIDSLWVSPLIWRWHINIFVINHLLNIVLERSFWRELLLVIKYNINHFLIKIIHSLLLRGWVKTLVFRLLKTRVWFIFTFTAFAGIVLVVWFVLVLIFVDLWHQDLWF